MNPLGPFQLYRINSETEKEMNNLFFFSNFFNKQHCSVRDAHKASHSTVAFPRQRLITQKNSALLKTLNTHCAAL